jgi:putative thioredoxin
MEEALGIVWGVTRVIDVDEASFEERVLRASREVPVVVDFWAGWCRPCLVLGPILERLAEEYGGRFVLAKVDVDANPALSSGFGIQGIPAVKAFRGGEVVDEFVGVQPEELLRRFLDGIVPSEAEPVVAEGRAAEAVGDLERAETLYRKAVEADPELDSAAVGLARLLLDRGKSEEARPLLSRFPGSAEARALQARADLAHSGADGNLEQLRARADADEGDHEAALAVAAADAAAGRHRDALERCLRVISHRGEGREAARDLMVKVFEMLGDEHPLTAEYRPRLARALY